MAQRWAGRRVTTARARIKARMEAAGGALPCWRPGCNVVLTVDGTWTVGHIVPRHYGGPMEPWNEEPECASHNFAEGGRIGARITNAKRADVTTSVDLRGDRGLRSWR